MQLGMVFCQSLEQLAMPSRQFDADLLRRKGVLVIVAAGEQRPFIPSMTGSQGHRLSIILICEGRKVSYHILRCVMHLVRLLAEQRSTLL